MINIIALKNQNIVAQPTWKKNMWHSHEQSKDNEKERK